MREDHESLRNKAPGALPDWIKPGAYCVTRDGSKARIYAVDGEQRFPVHGAIQTSGVWIISTWTACGDYLHSKSIRHGDLVGPWVERPEVDWAAMPAWMDWAAMDADGRWYCYPSTPVTQDSAYWYAANYVVIPSDYAPKWVGDWKDSLVVRPGWEKLNAEVSKKETQ